MSAGGGSGGHIGANASDVGAEASDVGANASDDSGVQLGVGQSFGRQAAVRNGLRGAGRLPFAGLDQQHAPRRQPVRRLTGHPTMQAGAIGPAVEGHSRFMQSRLRRHEPDLGGRYVRRVDGKDVDATSELRRQRTEQVTRVHVSACRDDIAASTGDGSRIDIRSVQVCVAEGGRDRNADRTGAAAQVEDDEPVAAARSGPQTLAGRNRLRDEELAPATRDEHTGAHADPQPAEFGPAEDVLERQPGGALIDHPGQLGRRMRGSLKQLSFLFGEDAARRPEPGHDVWRHRTGPRPRGRATGHRSPGQ